MEVGEMRLLPLVLLVLVVGVIYVSTNDVGVLSSPWTNEGEEPPNGSGDSVCGPDEFEAGDGWCCKDVEYSDGKVVTECKKVLPGKTACGDIDPNVCNDPDKRDGYTWPTSEQVYNFECDTCTSELCNDLTNDEWYKKKQTLKQLDCKCKESIIPGQFVIVSPPSCTSIIDAKCEVVPPSFPCSNCGPGLEGTFTLRKAFEKPPKVRKPGFTVTPKPLCPDFSVPNDLKCPYDTSPDHNPDEPFDYDLSEDICKQIYP
jgi:hypothetical protein